MSVKGVGSERATRSPGALGAAVGGVLVALLVLPVAILVVGAWDVLAVGLGTDTTWAALALSLETTLWTLAIAVLAGTPLAWWLSRAASGWLGTVQSALETALRLPMVLPPAVAGLALLLAFGRTGPVGGWLESMGIRVAFSTQAVVLAQLFVAAPYYVTAATEGLRAVPDSALEAGRALGATARGTFWRVALPMARPALLAGAAACWARALGEFGATLIFAGNLPERSQTLPLAIYAALETDLAAARAIAVLLVLVAVGVLGVLRWASR